MDIAYLYNLVFLWFIDLASQAAASDSIMNDELVGLKAWLLVQLWSCKTKHLKCQEQNKITLFIISQLGMCH